MILLSGITGRIGGAAARALLAAGNSDVCAIVRSPDKPLPEVFSRIDRRTADMNDVDALRAAMTGVQSALLVAPNGSAQHDLEKNFIDAAAAAGVAHIVKISSMEASASARAPIPKLHYLGEQYLRAAGPAWTILQPNFFMQNFLMYAAGIKGQQSFTLPFADASIAPVDCEDIGAVVATLLGNEAHFGKTYTLTAESAVSLNDIAADFSDVCGQPIRYVDLPPAEFRAFMQKIVPDAWLADAVSDLFEEIRGGGLAATSTDLRTLLARAPTTMRDFIFRHKEAFC